MNVLLRGVMVIVVSAAIGCGGDGSEAMIPDARPSVPPDARLPDNGVNSNLAGLDWRAQSASLSGMVIVSSNFVQENLGGQIFQLWYAEIRSNRSGTVCFPEATLELQNASGTTLARMNMFADAQPHWTTLSLSTPCIRPGGTAAVFAIESPAGEAPIAQIRRAAWTIEGLESVAAQPHPAAPQISGAVVEIRPRSWSVAGTVQATSGTIRNIGMTAYPLGANGWIVDSLIDVNLGELSPGALWPYETTASSIERFSRYHQYVDFIEGAQATERVALDPAVSTAASRLATLRELRGRLDAQRNARSAAERQ